MPLGYVTIGARDGEASGRFYDSVLNAIGMERKFADGGWIGYGQKGSDSPDVFVVSATANGLPASAGNGNMLAFLAATKDAVNIAHRSGLQAGGSDEGAPGPRPADSTTFYGAYLRDPTGNKICIFHRPS